MRLNFLTEILLIATSVSLLNLSAAENILFFFASGSWSHKVSIWPLVTALADQGHNVTFISGHSKQPYSNVKVNDLLSPTIQAKLKSIYGVDRFLERLNGRELDLWAYNNVETVKTCQLIFDSRGDPALNYVLYEGQFDLVINNAVLGDCGLIVAHQKKAKMILSYSTPMLTWLYDELGFPDESATIPDMTLEFQYPMSLWNRIVNYVTPIVWYFRRQYEIYPQLEGIMRHAYNLTSVPSLLQVQQNVSLVLISTHFSTDFARSLPPAVVNIGGMQCWKPTKPLAGEFKDIMDKAINGVVLVAFGSTVNLASMPNEMKTYFFEMFQRFPTLTFIWRWDGPPPEHAPKNLIISKWLPQVQILGHPNCKAFISHAGLNSITEATFNGVPVILLPLFADQDYNAYRVQADHIGIRLEIRELSTDVLTNAVESILKDHRYQRNMKISSEILKDRPISPIESGVYWVNFVLRHENTRSLKPMQHLPWFQRRQLDLLTILFAMLTTILAILLYVVLKAMKHLMCLSSSRNVADDDLKKRT